MKRFDKLIFSMMANEKFNIDSKILVIGPRSESDILKLNSYGYKNIESIDLLSYSPRIKVMDACNLLYDTNTFDCIFCGWVLPYIKNPQLIADNIFRVIKNDGMISIGIAYHDDKLINSLSGSVNQINSLDSIKKLFKDKIKNIFFQYDAELKHKSMIDIYKITEQESSSIIISFTVKK
jgi:SAM-dependent methyltransferase